MSSSQDGDSNDTLRPGDVGGSGFNIDWNIRYRFGRMIHFLARQRLGLLIGLMSLGISIFLFLMLTGVVNIEEEVDERPTPTSPVVVQLAPSPVPAIYPPYEIDILERETTEIVAEISETVEPAPLFAAWPHIKPVGPQIIDVSVYYAALAKTSFPSTTWYDLWRMSSTCEASAEQRPSFGPMRAATDVWAIGDGGFSLGTLQVFVLKWPELAAKYNLLSLEGNLRAAYEIYVSGGFTYVFWSCKTVLN